MSVWTRLLLAATLPGCAAATTAALPPAVVDGEGPRKNLEEIPLRDAPDAVREAAVAAVVGFVPARAWRETDRTWKGFRIDGETTDGTPVRVRVGHDLRVREVQLGDYDP